MTDRSPDRPAEPAGDPSPAASADPDAGAPAPEPRGPVRAPGLTSFTIEGRSAPALFVIGWLATLMGLGAALVAVLAGGGVAGRILFVVGLVLLTLGLVAAAGSQAIERRAAAARAQVPAAYAGPSPILVFAAALVTTVLLIVLIGSPLVGLGLDPSGPLASFVSLLVTAAAYVLLIRLLVVGTGALSWRELGVRGSTGSAARDLVWGAVLAVPVLFATGLLAVLLSRFLPVPPDVLPPAPDQIGLLLNLATAAVIAPVAEELFFRGFATTAWLRSAGPVTALVRGSLFFSLAHVLTLTGADAGQALGFAATAFVVRLPVSFALGWLFLRRGAIWAPIGLHAVFNGLQVLALAGAGRLAGG